MYFEDDTVYTAEFRQSGEETQVARPELERALIDFLDHYGEPALVGKPFYGIIGTGNGEMRLTRLIEAAGYPGDPEGFYAALLKGIEEADSADPEPVRINNVALPHLLVTAVLEVLVPGSRFITVRNVDQLEQLTNISVPEGDRDDMQRVIDTYPVRLSMHIIRQMRVSKNVAYQYLPFVEELDPVGHSNTWIGQFHQGLLEQMYRNRVIFLLNMSCPVYCRFCFRKHKESRNQQNPTVKDVNDAVAHVAASPEIKEIVITGGDPFLNRANIAAAIDGLKEVPHVQTLRLATRSIAYYPHLFLGDDRELIDELKRKNIELKRRGKRMEVATHFIHPAEISVQSLAIITELVKSGIAVYVQTPFLKDCNDEGPELVRLYSLLRGAGAELHYIYIPCSPIHGNSIYWTSIDRGLAVGRYLRAHLSDRVIPRICTATPIGKLDWHTSGWAVEPDSENDQFVWLRSPYDAAYFESFAPLTSSLEMLRKNEEGTFDVRYMADMGENGHFFGKRIPRQNTAQEPPDPDQVRQRIAGVREKMEGDGREEQSIVPTGYDGIFRIHKTRAEMDIEAGAEVFEYLEKNDEITDVVLAGETDAIRGLYRIERIIERLREIPHINAIRIRSHDYAAHPERYSEALIDRLGGLNKLTVSRPQRLEIETWFLHPDEVLPEHREIARALGFRGITVYADVPLFSGINDHPETIQRLAYRLRESGIEFHHLYIGGLPMQREWARKHPVDTEDVIDIATKVRRDGSGREIPRYIIRTELGEVDFGISGVLRASKKGSEGEEGLRVRLVPFSLDYYREMAPHFAWPQGVGTDADGSPILPVPGLFSSTGFMVETEG